MALSRSRNTIIKVNWAKIVRHLSFANFSLVLCGVFSVFCPHAAPQIPDLVVRLG
jgi:hypothetical protein